MKIHSKQIAVKRGDVPTPGKKQSEWGKERMNKIFSSRAQKLANRKATTIAKATTQILTFSIGLKEKYAVLIDQISEIRKLEKWTPVPRTHELITGVINIKGDLYCLAELAKILGHEPPQPVPSGYVLMVKQSHNGLIIKNPGQMISIDTQDLVKPPEHKETLITRYTKAMTKSDHIVLDLDKVMTHPVFTDQSLT